MGKSTASKSGAVSEWGTMAHTKVYQAVHSKVAERKLGNSDGEVIERR